MATQQVLKASDVKFEVPLRLSLNPSAVPASTGPQTTPAPTALPARARVVESHPEYALVEVTCSCGQTTYVRCEYEPAQA